MLCNKVTLINIIYNVISLITIINCKTNNDFQNG